jgi:hypothetical protein
MSKVAECWLCDTSAEQHEEHNRKPDSPVGEYSIISQNSNDPGYVNRILVATPTLGQVRIEWVQARYGQIIPTNWSMVQMSQYMHSYIPIQFQVADAQNMIVKECIEKNFEWLFLLEDDVILPQDAFIRLNKYMRDADVPVVSGLYYTKSFPPEPMIYRGRGNSFYTQWKRGEKIWADGVPTGCLLIHRSLLQVMWDAAEEYDAAPNFKARRVFDTPRAMWYDKETGQFNSTTGTSDLDWCTRVMKDNVFEKAGWKDFAKKKFPFLVDTNIFCDQIDMSGRRFPSSLQIFDDAENKSIKKEKKSA